MILEIIINVIYLLFLVLIIVILLSSIIRGAPFVPTQRKRVEAMLESAQVKNSEKALDLGSGDGRIVIALAQAGAEAHGYEINPVLVWWSRRKIKQAGIGDRAFIHWGSFWRIDFSAYSVITVFGISYIMKELGEKLKKELKPGSRVVSNAFAFPDWPPVSKKDGAYLYKI